MPRRTAALLVGLAALAAAVAVIAAASGGAQSPRRAARYSQAVVTDVQIVPRLALSAGAVVRRLPPAPWAVSFDVRLMTHSRLDVRLGSGAPWIVLSRDAGSTPALAQGTRVSALPDRRGWGRGGWRHVEITAGARTRLSIDGTRLLVTPARGSVLSFRAKGQAVVEALVVSRDQGQELLLQRLAELHARVPPGRFPVGADLHDQLHFDAGWTSGFWAGALWQAAAVAPAGGMFEHWALAATIAHFGHEHADTHDVGFMYGESSLAAWRALCSAGSGAAALCARLRRSVLAAADQLRVLAATNARAGTIPTDGHSPQPDTIVDSMMNIDILTWASQASGDPAYAQLASRHAHAVAALLVRPDGSTTQSVNFDRATGRVLRSGTHQGLSDTSTWARGQAWAVYGFAQTGAALGDAKLIAVSERAAAYVASRLPADGVPRWDYAAPAGAPVDVSAGVITAAGLLHLDAACRRLPPACAQPERWAPLARRMLAASLAHAAPQPPLGYLGAQVLNHRADPTRWDDHAELIFGLTYALEAVRDLSPPPA